MAGVVGNEAPGLSCAETAALVNRVVLAVVCEADMAAAVAEQLLSRFRSLPDHASAGGASRVFVARAAYDAASAAIAEADPVDPRQRLDSPLGALATLPPRARAIVVLHDVERFDLAEVSSIVRAGDGIVATELFRARRSLGRLLALAVQLPTTAPSES